MTRLSQIGSDLTGETTQMKDVDKRLPSAKVTRRQGTGLE